MSLDAITEINQSRQFHRQYGANAMLPAIDWNNLFKYSKLDPAQIEALETLYQSAVPLALQVFDELHFDVFEPFAYKPQGLGLFERLAEQIAVRRHVIHDENSGARQTDFRFRGHRERLLLAASSCPLWRR